MTSVLVLLFLTNIQFIFGEECLDTDILHVNWQNLNIYGDIPDFGYEIEFDKFNLELVIDVNLTYLGYSVDKDENELGTTYILDFESKSAHIVPLNQPGTCSNRYGSDYENAPFTQWFEYSVSDPPIVGKTQYLAYPPGGRDWFIESIDCHSIHYRGHFSYKELYEECTNFDGTEKYSVLSTDDKFINLTLTFYINIVSPLINQQESGYYHIYQILSAPFVIAIQKTIYILEPIGMLLFSMSIIAVYKENQQNDFRLVLLTETAEYLKLNTPQLAVYPWNLQNNHGIQFHITDQFADNPCLNNKAYFCSQIWEIYADKVPCPPSDFSGLYGLQFEAICNDDGSAEQADNCAHWLSRYDEKVDLSTHLSWSDEICEATIWEVHFGAVMRFYSSDDFSLDPVDESYLYQVGEDKIFVEIEVNLPSGALAAFNVFKVQVINVWLCTTDPLIGEPLLDITNGSGGCLGGNIDNDGPYFIIKDYNDVMLYNATHLDENDANKPVNVVRFSFISPVTIVRDTLYIHAQLTLSLIETGRRRMMDDGVDATSDQIKHFIGQVNVDPTDAQPYQHIIDIDEYKKKNGFYTQPIKDTVDSEPFILVTRNVYDLLTMVTVFFGFWVFVNIGCLLYARYIK